MKQLVQRPSSEFSGCGEREEANPQVDFRGRGEPRCLLRWAGLRGLQQCLECSERCYTRPRCRTSCRSRRFASRNFDISHSPSPRSHTAQRRVSSIMHIHPISLALATLVAYRGTRSGSLNTSGALAAATLGYTALANPLSVFGVCLLGFYLAGSRATKVRALVRHGRSFQVRGCVGGGVRVS